MFPAARKPGHAALRRGRASMPGQLYHVTTTTADRHCWFTELVLARLVARALNAADLLGASRTICWVLMPDHPHWMVQPGEGQDLSRLVGRFKAVTGKQINEHLHRIAPPCGALAFHDHALRHDEDIESVARYIVGNPMRAGLCALEREYSHWDSVWAWAWRGCRRGARPEPPLANTAPCRGLRPSYVSSLRQRAACTRE